MIIFKMAVIQMQGSMHMKLIIAVNKEVVQNQPRQRERGGGQRRSVRASKLGMSIKSCINIKFEQGIKVFKTIFKNNG